MVTAQLLSHSYKPPRAAPLAWTWGRDGIVRRGQCEADQHRRQGFMVGLDRVAGNATSAYRGAPGARKAAVEVGGVEAFAWESSATAAATLRKK